jgi:hypothetical protein
VLLANVCIVVIGTRHGFTGQYSKLEFTVAQRKDGTSYDTFVQADGEPFRMPSGTVSLTRVQNQAMMLNRSADLKRRASKHFKKASKSSFVVRQREKRRASRPQSQIGIDFVAMEEGSSMISNSTRAALSSAE